MNGPANGQSSSAPSFASQPPSVARGAVLCLAVGQTLCWAGIYYLFPALLSHWEADLGWSKAEFGLAFTLALVITAIAAPWTGRLIDRGHGPLVLGVGAFAGGLLVLGLSLVSTQWQFMVLWAGIGLAAACSLYEPCFAFLTRHYGLEARRPITLVTLVAGFAGTVSFPVNYTVAETAGWRGAVVVAGLAVSFLAAPMLFLAARHVARGRPVLSRAAGGATNGRLFRLMRTASFWLLAASFAAIALNHGILITHLLPLLHERGIGDQAAVLAASMIGPMQVTGRLAMMALERAASMVVIGGLAIAFMVAAAFALAGAATVPALIVAFVVLQGAGNGVTSITRPVVTASLLGSAGFGVVSGALAVAFMGAMALAPTLGAGLWGLGGAGLVIETCAAIALFGLACHVGAAAFSARVPEN